MTRYWTDAQRDDQLRAARDAAVNRFRWTDDQRDLLRKLYAETPTSEIVALVGHPIDSVYRQAYLLGLCKSAEYRRSCGIQPGSGVGARYRFPAGHAPWNKGVRSPGVAHGRQADTQFKPGNRPHTWQPVGTVMKDYDGYLRIKIRERLKGEACIGWHKNIWPPLHRHIWQQHHGPIPPGHALVFRDGDRSNCEIGNLELRDVIRLNGVLKRRIRRLSGTK